MKGVLGRHGSICVTRCVVATHLIHGIWKVFYWEPLFVDAHITLTL